MQNAKEKKEEKKLGGRLQYRSFCSRDCARGTKFLPYSFIYAGYYRYLIFRWGYGILTTRVGNGGIGVSGWSCQAAMYFEGGGKFPGIWNPSRVLGLSTNR